jgi:hypothetical protein
MADTIKTEKHQSKAEKRQWDVDFSLDTPTGESVVSAVAVHTPPSGTASTPVVGSIVANVVPVMLGPLSVEGIHELKVSATLSNSEKIECLLLIPVDY